MILTYTEIHERITSWLKAWDKHNLDAVMALMHEDVVFENWTGQIIKGKQKLHQAWMLWFLQHGNFMFIAEDIFVDEQTQKALFRWRLEWPSQERNFKGKREIRRGVDLLHFRDGKIDEKLCYSKTSIEIDGQAILLNALN